jgi:hypothetical protein
MLVLLFREQTIEHTQIHRVDPYLGDGRRRFVLHQRFDQRRPDRLSLGQQATQRCLHRRLALLRRQVQDAKVFLNRRARVL